MKSTFFLLLLLPLFAFTQEFADKNYYLIDSLVLEDLSDDDRILIDSCLNEYHLAKEDTSKANAISFLVEDCQYEDARAKYNLWIFDFCKTKISSQIKIPFYKKKYAEAIGNRVSIFYAHGKIEEALVSCNQSLVIHKELGNKLGIASILNDLGVIYDGQGKIKEALDYHHQSLVIRKELGDKEGVAGSINNIGFNYSNQGKIEEALAYYHQSLVIYKELGNKESIAVILNNIGSIYDEQGKIEEALDYYHQSLVIYKELGNKRGIALMLNNIGFVYDGQGKIKEALDYYNKSLVIRKELGNKLGIALMLNNIGSIYDDQGKIEEALDYYHQSLAIRKELGNKKGISSVANSIGKLLFNKGKFKEAKEYLSEGYQLSLALGFPQRISNSALALSKLALKEQNYKEAYEMYALHIKMRDSINNLDTQKAAIEQEAKYQYETQKALDDAESEKLIAIEKEAAEKQKVITTATIIGIIFLGFFLAFVFNRLRLAKKQQKIITAQKQEVEVAHQKTEQQKHIIEGTHKEITDSINYAKRLQDAILPSSKEINKYIPNNFILFEPKDVVSGDFYWFEHKESTVENSVSFLAAADCTGHGVPGAMVSVVCSNALNRTVNEFGITSPSKILDKTRELVIDTFAKSGEEVKDGMDIALCAFTEDKLIFSGANNPLWIVRETTLLTPEQLENRTTVTERDLSLIEFKANKQPIGLYAGMTPFIQTEIKLEDSDVLYFFTDGFADQFGGEKGKKFKYRPFKKLLIEVSKDPMSIQKKTISQKLKDWKGDLEQVDDICIIGVKV